METFNYLGRILDRSDNNWPAVYLNVSKARQIWSQIGKLLRREGLDPRVSEMFYQAVVQVLLLFGAKTWFFLAEMSRNLKGVHMGFLRQLMGQKATR